MHFYWLCLMNIGKLLFNFLFLSGRAEPYLWSENWHLLEMCNVVLALLMFHPLGYHVWKRFIFSLEFLQKLNRPRFLFTKRSAKRSAHVHQLSFVVVIVVVVIVVVIIVVVVIVVVITAKDFFKCKFLWSFWRYFSIQEEQNDLYHWYYVKFYFDLRVLGTFSHLKTLESIK